MCGERNTLRCTVVTPGADASHLITYQKMIRIGVREKDAQNRTENLARNYVGQIKRFKD